MPEREPGVLRERVRHVDASVKLVELGHDAVVRIGRGVKPDAV
jgi:hypothetical protein